MAHWCRLNLNPQLTAADTVRVCVCLKKYFFFNNNSNVVSINLCRYILPPPPLSINITNFCHIRHFATMNTQELQSALLNDAYTREIVSGVYAADTIPLGLPIPTVLIINSDNKSQPGTHWLAIYVDKNRNAVYFDSFGRQPLVKNIQNFLDKQCKSYTYNHTCVQSYTTSTCGEYSVLFCAVLARGYSLRDYLNIFKNSPSLLANEKILRQVYGKYFASQPNIEAEANDFVRQCACVRPYR
jgi:hypothetical protein